MKKITSIFLLAFIGFILFTGIYNINGFPKYGESDISRRVSENYINKNVTENNINVEFGKSQNFETGSANIVTSIVVNYRSLDTLGEVTVLFLSALGISLLSVSYTHLTLPTK